MKKLLISVAILGFGLMGTNAFACPCHEQKAPVAEENSGCGCNHDGNACGCNKDGKSCDCAKDGKSCSCGEAACSCGKTDADHKTGCGCGNHH